MTRHDVNSSAIPRAALHDQIRMLAGAAPTSRLVDEPGFMAAVAPRFPHPTANVATIVRPGDGSALERLAAAYRTAGVQAWSLRVLGPDDLGPLTTLLAGYRLVRVIQAMLLDLGGWRAPADLPDVRASGSDIATLGVVNEFARRDAVGLARAFTQIPPGLDVRLYQGCHEGRIACALAAVDHPHAAGVDCGVHFVATLPRARRRGFATALVATALADAQQRGCSTSSLQAGLKGAPLYARLGYRPVARVHRYDPRTT